MSIRSNTLPMGRDLAPELQDILRRNGMQAHIVRQGDGFALAVQGHDSPTSSRCEPWWIGEPILLTKRHITPWQDYSPMTSICPEVLFMHAMPMVEWLWDFMAIVSVLANMDVCLGTDEDSIR